MHTTDLFVRNVDKLEVHCRQNIQLRSLKNASNISRNARACKFTLTPLVHINYVVRYVQYASVEYTSRCLKYS